jgi:hypothetical protein
MLEMISFKINKRENIDVLDRFVISIKRAKMLCWTSK